MENSLEKIDTELPKSTINGVDGLCSSARLLPPWSLYSVGVAMAIGYILVPLLLSNCLLILAPLLSPTVQIFYQQGITFLCWIGIFAWLHWRYAPIRPLLGLKWSGSRKSLCWETLILFMLTLSAYLALGLLWQALTPTFPFLKNDGMDIYSNYSVQELTITSVFAVLMAPALEETVFRGYLQGAFHKVASPWLSLVLTALVFLLFHGMYFNSVTAVTQVLVLALLFGYWRERTGSIIPAMVAHMANNALATLYMFTAHKP